MRDGDGLGRLVGLLDGGENGEPREEAATAIGHGGCALDEVEAANLRLVSRLIAAGARRRAESRGCHRRTDAAVAAEPGWHTVLRLDGNRLLVGEEEL
jgi:L-aspartate oxidase